VDEIFALLYRRTPSLVESAFFSEFGKDLRAVLLRAAKHLCAQAEKRFAEELSRAREVLKAENFDDEAILQSPRVHDAKSRVERFEHLIAAISSAPDNQLWQHAPSLLAKDD
jgi:hypothetical protein